MKLLETPVFTILAVIAAWWVGSLGLLDLPGRRRLLIYGLVILVACVVLLSLAVNTDVPAQSLLPTSSLQGTLSAAGALLAQ